MSFINNHFIAWSSPKADPWSTLATTTTTGEVASSTGWADFSAAGFSEPSAFAAAFADRNSRTNHEEPKEQQPADPHQATSEPQQPESESSQAEEKFEKTQVESNASGDHSDAEERAEKEEGSNSEPQPSM